MNSVRLRPSGRLSFGFSKKGYKLHRLPKRSLAQRFRDESIGVVGAYVIDPEGIERVADMDLSNLSNLRKLSGRVRAKRGLKGMTGHGRLLVKDAAYWLQKEYGKARLAFWTVTIPPENLNEQLIGNWAGVVKSVREKLSYHLEKNELPPYIVGVTEIQPKRYVKNHDVPPLHLHIVYVAAKQDYVPLIHKDTLSKLWADTIATLSGVSCRQDTVSSVQFIRKDVVGYLGKYMSKGFYDMEGLDKKLCPPSWYFCTKPLKDIVKGLIVYHSGEWVNELYEYFRSNGELFGFTKAVTIFIDTDKEIKVGWYGELKGEQERNHAWNMIVNFARLNKPELAV